MPHRRREYIWKEKEQCPYCKARMTNGRLMRHVAHMHTDKQWHAFMQHERHKFDGVLKAIKEAEEVMKKK